MKGDEKMRPLNLKWKILIVWGVVSALSAMPTGASETGGITIGDYIFSPSVTAGLSYNDNVLLGSTDEKSSVIYNYGGSIGFQSKWNRHSINLDVSAQASQYENNLTEDSESFTYSGSCRVDISDTWHLQVSGSYQDTFEERQVLEVIQVKDLTNIQNTRGSVGLFYQGAHWTASARVDTLKMEFEDQQTSESFVNHDDRDRQVHDGKLHLGYKFNSQWTFYINSAGNIIEYDETYDDFDHQRDSAGYNIAFGIQFLLEKIGLSGDVHMGWMEQEYDDPILGTTTGWDGLVSIGWQATPGFSLQLFLDREINETTIPNSASYITSKADLKALYRVDDHVSCFGSIGFTRDSYEGIDLRYKTWQTDIGLTYAFNHQLNLKAVHTYTHRRSNGSSGDWNLNVYVLSLAYRF